MRLIDANYLKTWFGEKDLYTYDYIIGTIDDAPTVKPEQNIIRCKDCKWWEQRGYDGNCHNPIWGDGWANYPPPSTLEEGFCYRAELRGEEE